MAIPGNLTLTTVACPLLGRAGFVLDFTPLALSSYLVTCYILQYPDDALTEALITHVGTDAKITSTAIFVELSTEERELVSAQAVYYLVVVITVPSTTEIISQLLANLYFQLTAFSGSFTPIFMQPVLSSTTVNRVAVTAYTGGIAGALDYITTADKVLGTIIEFILASGGAVEQWVLEAGTNATDPGTYQRGTDYSDPSNTRVWRRCM